MERDSQRFLLQRARAAIAARISRQPLPQQVAPDEVARTRCGLFVSLHTRELPGSEAQLRGCIGHLHPRYNLEREIDVVAEQAAFADQRFAPLAGLEELQRTTIEISLLSPFEAVSDINEIDPGRHGLYILIGCCSGLLLPQVATQREWDRLTFLRHLCLKAGCRADCWKSPRARLYRFSAEVFDEDSPGVR